MKFKLIIYRGDRKTCVVEKLVDNVEEVESMLEQYEGFWCQVVDVNTGKTILEGAFDEDFLDETYYQKED
jgi:hypothetical protein